MSTLKELYEQHNGKVSDKWQLYLREYETILEAYRKAPIMLLEIGIQNGGSLEIWSRYFRNARKIIGCDIDPGCGKLRYDDPRIELIIGDVNDERSERQILSLAGRLDVVIDDGSHRSGDIIRSFLRYFPHLNDGSVYTVEDLHCSYWQEYEGGLSDPFSSIAFFKRLADVVNHEHWGIGKAPSIVLDSFFKKYGTRIDEEVLEHVHSVQFLNSMCVVRKMAPRDNTLGERVVAGSEETVTSGFLEFRSSSQVVPSQSSSWRITRRLRSVAHQMKRVRHVTETHQKQQDRTPAPIFVLLATYNGESFLEEQVRSIQAQHGHHNWQLIIRDDGSSDGTRAVAKKLAAEDPRIVSIPHSRRGLGPSRNFGILMKYAANKGASHVMLSDQDDVWLPNKMEVLLEEVKRLESTHGSETPILVHSDLTVVDEHLRPMHASFMKFQGISNEWRNPLGLLLVQNFVTGCTCLINRPLLVLSLPVPTGVIMHDWWLALVAAATGRIGYVDQSTVQYRQHGQNTIGAKSFWKDLMLFPSRVEAQELRKREMHHIWDTMVQGQLLAARLKSRDVTLARRDTDRIREYSGMRFKPPLARVYKAIRLGLRRQNWIRQVLFYRTLMKWEPPRA